MKHLLTFATDSSPEASAEVRIGLRSLPFLADHAFQDVVVLPGSFYIELGLCVHQRFSKCAPGIVRNVIFQNPVIVSQEDVTIQIEVTNIDVSTAEYNFYEVAAENGGAPIRRQHAARLVIDSSPS